MLKAAVGSALGLVGVSALVKDASARRCRRNNDCRANELCDKDRRECVECRSDRNCGGSQQCVNGKCVSGCRSNNDCGNNQFCVRSECVDCRRDRDCSNNEFCNGRNRCVRLR
jgi:hypothetical protein